MDSSPNVVADISTGTRLGMEIINIAQLQDFLHLPNRFFKKIKNDEFILKQIINWLPR